MHKSVKGIENPSQDVYGAEFREIKPYIPYFQRTIKKYVPVPWLAEYEDRWYMNTYKRLNEPPVVTYKELRFSSIPNTNYGKFNEGFGEINQKYLIILILLILFIFVASIHY